MSFFKPEDWIQDNPELFAFNVPQRQLIADLANAKLQREGKVVYQYNKGPWSQVPVETMSGSELIDHKALLIAIETMCTHPSEKVFLTSHDEGGEEYACKCGARVKVKRDGYEVAE